ncbi:hypothetical protein B484DRAFT_214376 [Ochromonadaceae sp. CCMP2298]|nr:hypothetical protein B484DRAFT_214376 [Ochromonadaceae sp. CCMP2298]
MSSKRSTALPLLSPEAEGKRHFMEIEIKFSRGRSDRITVYEDDDASVLAREFVMRHRLKGKSVPLIAQYIQVCLLIPTHTLYVF